jgi:hypothetical protein
MQLMRTVVLRLRHIIVYPHATRPGIPDLRELMVELSSCPVPLLPQLFLIAQHASRTRSLARQQRPPPCLAAYAGRVTRAHSTIYQGLSVRNVHMTHTRETLEQARVTSAHRTPLQSVSLEQCRRHRVRALEATQAMAPRAQLAQPKHTNQHAAMVRVQSAQQTRLLSQPLHVRALHLAQMVQTAPMLARMLWLSRKLRRSMLSQL